MVVSEAASWEKTAGLVPMCEVSWGSRRNGEGGAPEKMSRKAGEQILSLFFLREGCLYLAMLLLAVLGVGMGGDHVGSGI